MPLNNVGPSKPTTAKEIAQSESKANDDAGPCGRPPRKLQRVNTVADSQIDDGGTLVVVDSAEHFDRPLQRVISVQHSEYDDNEELMSAADLATIGAGSVGDLDYRSQYFNDYHQSTFDPACSALDRDAARFGRTQTQPQPQRVDDSDVDETHDDPDQGYQPEDEDHALQRSPDQPPEKIAPSYITPEEQSQRHLETRPDYSPRKGIRTASQERDDSAYESGDPTKRGEIDVPSSPPQLRPSQVSTVMPTQLSQPQHAQQIFQSPRKTQTQPFTLPSSPHYSHLVMSGTFSSSPLPAPPWSSPSRAHAAQRSKQASRLERPDQLDILTDFSLPPPPSLSSSRRQTPASSST